MALQFEPDGSSRRARRTIAFYLGALFLLLAVFVGSARNVILVPWTARTNVTVASHGTHAYLFGGRGTDGDFLSGILRVDFASGRLKRSGTLPEPMLSTRVAVLADGNVLLAGGVTRTRTSDSLLIFHPENSRVSSAGTLFAPRAYGFASEIDGRVLYFGGFDGQKSVNTIVSIDPASGSSRIVGTLPVPVEQMGGAVVGGMVYLFGGENSAGQLFDSVLRYEPATGETKRVAVLPAAASRFSTAVVDGRILLCGGWGEGAKPSILSFDPRFDSFRPVRSMSAVDAVNLSLVAAGGRAYLAGGEDPTHGRTIGIDQLILKTGKLEPVRLRSYVWW